jgi:hypothetical protein
MNREQTFALWAKGKDSWNRWAQEMLERRKALELAGKWQVDLQGRGQNADTSAFLELARAEFSTEESPQNFETEADFSGLLFPDDVLFARATFSGPANFEKAKFGRAAHFNGARFADSAQFAGTTFMHIAAFTKGTFETYARFGAASFQGSARFTASRFLGGAEFVDVIFASTAEYAGTTFSGVAAFAEATFGGNARFAKAIFFGNAVFDIATFSGAAGFGSATFSKHAGFQGATFKSTAWFAVSRFDNEAEFGDAMFSGHAEFNFARFNGNANFKSVSFASSVNFRDVYFARAVNFSTAKFAGDALFSGTSFHGSAWFAQSNFDAFTTFSQAHFSRGAYFGAIFGRRAFSLAGTTFDGVPDFTQSHFEEAPRLDDVHIGPGLYGPGGMFQKLGRRGRRLYVDFRHRPARYRALKRLAIEGRDHVREQMFFASEISSTRFLSDWPLPFRFWHRSGWNGFFRFWFGVFYQVFSDFGRSILRPLVFWLLVTLSSAIWFLGQTSEVARARLALAPVDGWHTLRAYVHTSFDAWRRNLPCFLPSEKADPGIKEGVYGLKDAIRLRTDAPTEALHLALRNAFIVLESGSDAAHRTYGCLYGIELYGDNPVPIVPSNVSFVSAIQKAISGVFIFLFGVGVRNMFKMN